MCMVTGLRRYPLKGAAGESVDHILFNAEIGIAGDRQYALKRKPSVADGRWSPKGVFYVAMNRAVMPTQVPTYGADGQLDPACVAKIGAALGLDEPPAVLETQGLFNITDTNNSSISFLNLASVRELSKFMGAIINPYRFRMNVHLDGFGPFEELSWVTKFPGDQVITVGDVEFRVDDACERCRAVEANPETGEYDLEILKALDELLKSRGYPGSPHRNVHKVMGILARPLSDGRISVGDLITP
ncbi:MAG: Flavodoxin reductase (ferredoxin-NADPH reductase) family 1 [Parcubacteria group bacterium]|nr:Flavodoxin reductase (ferredoxin-NADPH reductase) family 1 [Parcubacteria group bacterium]